jgi:hypothetical protein
MSAEDREAENRNQQEFLDLAKRFRRATDPEEIKRLALARVSHNANP